MGRTLRKGSSAAPKLPYELSDADRLNIRGVLASSEQPYPRLRKSTPLTVAVHVAVELWNEDSANEESPVAKFAEAARQGSVDLVERTLSLTSSFSSNIARWSTGLFGSKAADPPISPQSQK